MHTRIFLALSTVLFINVSVCNQNNPEKIITVDGHLDSWDISDGAHDDGAGCMHAMEVIRIFKKLGIKPNHTLRAVMFMDEEISQKGGETYAEEARKKDEKHMFALESDRGATKSLGFSIDANDSIIEKIKHTNLYLSLTE
ncbi:MAG: M20/M25/M40 family metallo-hydrolase [Bacteroidales bacterium]